MTSKLRGLYKQLVRVGAVSVIATAITLPLLATSWNLGLSSLGLLTLVPLIFLVLNFGGDLPHLRGRVGKSAHIGDHVVPRTLLLAVLAVTSVVNSAKPLLPLIAIGVVAIALSLEIGTRVISERIQPIAIRLPRFNRPNSLHVNLTWVSVLSLAWTGLFTPLLSLDSESGLIHLVTALLVLAASLFAFVYAALIWRVQRGSAGALTKALSDYSPSFAIHWEAPKNTVYQIKMWLPYLEQVGVDFFVIVRTTKNFEEVRTITDRPVILRSDLKDIDSAIVPSLKAILYVNTATLNNHLVRFTDLTHVQLNHGDSDKAASSNPAFKIFTKNFVAGQAAIDRFERNGVTTPPDFFEVVGRPQVSSIETAQLRSSSSAIKTVLYAPTWHGFYEDSNHSSLKIGPVLVQSLVEAGTRVLFRPHPYSLRSSKYRRIIKKVEAYLADQNSKGGVQHLYGNASASALIESLFNESDALIGDVSSVVADYLQSGKPLSVVCINQSLQDLAGHMPVSQAAYVLDAGGTGKDKPQPAELQSRIQDVIGGLVVNDTLQVARADLKKYYLGDISPGNEVSTFVAALRRYVVPPK